MRKKARKKATDEELLDAIYTLQREWQRIEAIVEDSIEPVDRSLYKEKLAKAKYLFLLREARQRNLSATHYR